MLPAAEDVATTWELTKFVRCELELVGHAWKVLNLNHECWNPKTMDDIRCCDGESNSLAQRHVENWGLSWGTCDGGLLPRLFVGELPRPLNSIDGDVVNIGNTRWRNCDDLVLGPRRECEEDGNDDEGNNRVSNLGRDVVLSLLRELVVFLAMKDGGPENENHCEDADYCSGKPGALPEIVGMLIHARCIFGKTEL